MTLKRVVVDSSGWIEVFTNGGQAEHFLALMADEAALVVPAICIFEVFKWGLLKKPDRLRRSLFQASRSNKLATNRAINGCYNC